MISLEAQRQKRYRDRKSARAEKMRQALESILTKLDGNDKALAVELRALAQEGITYYTQ